MLPFLVPLLILMIFGALVALESRDLLSGIISLGIIGFALTIIFLILQAPDLAIVQIIIETLTLVILIAAVLRTSREDCTESWGMRKAVVAGTGLIFTAVFIWKFIAILPYMPVFGEPQLRMARVYLDSGLTMTGAVNLVAAVILDFRAYDTLGEATVLFTSVAGVVAVLRTVGRKRS